MAYAMIARKMLHTKANEPSTLNVRHIILIFVAITSWIIGHRYGGICHDGVFYAGQALQRLAPDMFQNDLFFAFGSQDNYTAFSPAYGWAIKQFGLTRASMIMVILAHLAWIGSAGWLIRHLLAGFWYWSGLILVFSIPSGYGSFGLLHYAEPFLTARSCAEPLALLAAGFAVRGRATLAVGAWLAATAMHPIMALPCGIFITLTTFRPKHIFYVSIPAVCTVGLLIDLRISPFVNQLAPMDGTWLQLAVARTPFTFLQHWENYEYYEPALIALVLLLRALTEGSTNRRIWVAGLAVWGAGFVLSTTPIIWPAVLLVQMQAWRVLWFIKVFAIIAATSLLREYWQRSMLDRLLLGALGACALNIDNPMSIGAAGLIALVFLAHDRREVKLKLSPSFYSLAWTVLGSIILLKILAVAELSLVSVDLFRPISYPATIVDRVLLLAEQIIWVVGPLMLLISWWLMQNKPTYMIPQLSVTTVLLGASAIFWNGTDPLQLAQQRVWSRGIPELSGLLENNKLVYWDEGVRNLWFGLRRGNYASSMQLAGIVYSRKTAMEGKRRLDRLEALGTKDAILEWFPTEERITKPSARVSGLIHVCHDQILDYVILSTRFTEGYVTSFKLFEGAVADLHLYDCAALRTLPDIYADEADSS